MRPTSAIEIFVFAQADATNTMIYIALCVISMPTTDRFIFKLSIKITRRWLSWLFARRLAFDRSKRFHALCFSLKQLALALQDKQAFLASAARHIIRHAQACNTAKELVVFVFRKDVAVAF
jgi:hypothetical protein